MLSDIPAITQAAECVMSGREIREGPFQIEETVERTNTSRPVCLMVPPEEIRIFMVSAEKKINLGDGIRRIVSVWVSFPFHAAENSLEIKKRANHVLAVLQRWIRLRETR